MEQIFTSIKEKLKWKMARCTNARKIHHTLGIILSAAVALNVAPAGGLHVMASGGTANSVAKVEMGGETTFYDTIESAWAAAQGNTATITLLSDADASACLEAAENSDITLDCGGNTLTGSGSITIDMEGGSLAVENGTVKNNRDIAIKVMSSSLTVDTSAVIEETGSYGTGISLAEGSTVNISGTVRGGLNGVMVVDGTLNVYQGAVISANGSSGRGIYANYYRVAVTLYGGTITGKSKAIYLEESKRLGDLLGHTDGARYAFYKGGALVTEGLDGAILPAGTYTVAPCTHTFDDKGVCLVCGADAVAGVTVDSAVTYYGDIASAWDAVQGKTASFMLLKSADTKGVNNLAMLTLESGQVTLDMAEGVVLSSQHSNAVICVDGGELILNSGTIQNNNAYGGGLQTKGGTLRIVDGMITAYSGVMSAGGMTKITGGTFNGAGEFSRGLSKRYGTVEISGGTFSGGGSAIYISGDDSDTVADLLAENYAFRKEGAWVTDISARQITGTVTAEQAPVRINGQPEETSQRYGDEESLAIETVPGQSEGVKYQWYEVRNGSAEAVSGETGENFSPGGLSRRLDAGEYKYYCEAVIDGCTVRSKTVTFTVTPRPVNPVIEGAATKTYDGTAELPAGHSVTVKLNPDDVCDGDNVTAAAESCAYDTPDAGENKAITASGITLGGEKSGNYTLAVATATANLGTITKAAQAAPTAPSAEEDNIRDTSITLTAVENGEYRMGEDGIWQDSPVFTGLFPNTAYSFYARLKEDGNHNASPDSAAAGITTRKSVLNGAAVTVDGSYTYSGTEIVPKAENVTVKLNGITIDSSQYTITATDNINAGTATVTVTAVENGDCSGFASGTFTIGKAALTAEGSGLAEGIYGIKLSDMAVTGLTARLNGNEVAGTWKFTDTSVPDAGDTESYTAVFTPESGAENYKPLEADVVPQIRRAAGTLTVPETSFTKKLGVDNSFSLNCTTNGDGAVSYKSDNETVAKVSENGEVSIQGAGTAQITVSLAEGKNYTAAESRIVTVTVAKASGEQKPAVTKAEQERNETALNSKLKASQSGKGIRIWWGKVAGADGYDVYVQQNGKKFTEKSMTSIKNGKTAKATVRKVGGKALNLSKIYKVYVLAYRMEDGRKVVLGKSMTAYIAGKNNKKYTNAKAVKVKKSSYQMKKGKTAKIKAGVILEDRKKKQLSGSGIRKFRYMSTDKKVAVVSANGKIKAVDKGKCHIYVCAGNGYAKKIKVTVK